MSPERDFEQKTEYEDLERHSPISVHDLKTTLACEDSYELFGWRYDALFQADLKKQKKKLFQEQLENRHDRIRKILNQLGDLRHAVHQVQNHEKKEDAGQNGFSVVAQTEQAEVDQACQQTHTHNELGCQGVQHGTNHGYAAQDIGINQSINDKIQKHTGTDAHENVLKEFVFHVLPSLSAAPSGQGPEAVLMEL